MTTHIPLEATEKQFGRLETDARIYRPLDTVTVRVTGRAKGDARCLVRVGDPVQRVYFEAEVALTDNQGETRFVTGGRLGSHYVYLIWPDETRSHSRYLNFRLECETVVETGDRDFDQLYPFTRQAMRLGRREYDTPAGRFVGYISADTWHLDGIWLRDWIYGLPAYRYWETEMTCGLDRFLERQTSDGMLPDGIERDGRTWRVGLESDVEYILVLGVWQTWQSTGDDRWMASVLPRLEKALQYIRRDPKHWSAGHDLVWRQHSCDTWDFDIDGASDSGDRRHVIATCDQTGYVLAFRAMSRMYRHLGESKEADRWEKEATAYRERAVRLLWDGKKFRHHVHVDSIDHGDFDESGQLAMSNTWAMTRGLANGEQAGIIIDEYRRRHAETGDAYPWWSLQPGYPDHLGYFKQPYCRQGGYANGGLMPWVGGELCRAAFSFGREKYGVELLRTYADHLRRTGGAQVWYWPDGTPGFRTTNEVSYAGWGMAEWIHALMGGLAGINDETVQLRTVTVSPRWSAAGAPNVYAAARYAASAAYFAYRLTFNAEQTECRFHWTGSGEQAFFRVLCPERREVQSVRVNNADCDYELQKEGESRYVCWPATIANQGSAVIVYRPAGARFF